MCSNGGNGYSGAIPFDLYEGASTCLNRL